MRKGFHSFNTPENIKADNYFPLNIQDEGFEYSLVGGEWMRPLTDHVIVRRIEDASPCKIIATDADRSTRGVVLAVGPGKWVEGEWWKVHKYASGECSCDYADGVLPDRHWEWIPGYRATPEVSPGDIVLFNSKWNDFTHDEFAGSGCDGKDKLERPLSWRFDPMVHLVQEADIFCKVG